MKFLCALLAFAAVVSALDTDGTFGAAASFGAAGTYTIDYSAVFGTGTGPYVTFTTDKAVDVTVSIIASTDIGVTGGLDARPVGFDNFLAFTGTAEVGYQFEYTPSNAKITVASITTPALTVGAATGITDEADIGCLYAKQDTDAWARVMVDSYDSGDMTITIPLPDSGYYVITSFDQTITADSGDTVNVIANAMQTIAFGATVEIDFYSTTSNSITCEESDETTNDDEDAMLEAGIALGVYLDIDVTDDDNHDSTIRYTYSQAQCDAAGIDADMEEDLRFAYFADGKWNFMDDGHSVDTDAKVVSQSTTHFSQWGVFVHSGNDDDDSAHTHSPVVAVLCACVAAALAFAHRN